MTLYALFFYAGSFILFLVLTARIVRARGPDDKLAGLLAIAYLGSCYLVSAGEKEV